MLLKQVYALAKDYFLRSEQKYYALTLLALVIGFELFSVYMMVLLNEWNNQLYTSLQELNLANFWTAIKRFCWLAVFFLVTALVQLFVNLWMKLEWRNWMTRKYLDNWTRTFAFYGSKVINHETDNPDQRLTQDIQEFIDTSTSLFIGFINACTTLLSFGVILWSLSGIETLKLFGHTIEVHGWLVWVAFIYALTATFIMHLIGRVLYNLLFMQENREADLRYSLMRVRVFAESIALYKANDFEKDSIFNRLFRVIENTKLIIKKNLQMVSFNTFYRNVSIVFPFIIMSPKFFSGAIKLGDLTQIAGAFGSVQGALSWVIDSYSSIANLKANVYRLNGFNESVAKWNEAQMQLKEVVSSEEAKSISMQNLELLLPNNQVLFTCPKLNFSQGNYLITGPSGSGKSTLFRAFSGIWPFVKGQINIPANLKIMFLPQVSYMPIGSLHQVLCYPDMSQEVPAKLITLLQYLGLDQLMERLEEIEEWSRVLSLGEQQKVAFIRTVLAEPDVVFLDEATSAIDEESEAACYEMLKAHLPKATIISIGHRSTVKKYHDKVLVVKNKVLQAA